MLTEYYYTDSKQDGARLPPKLWRSWEEAGCDKVSVFNVHCFQTTADVPIHLEIIPPSLVNKQY